jgi:copper chaperone CopZ
MGILYIKVLLSNLLKLKRWYKMANIQLNTKGMHCPSCEMLVKDVLEEIEGINGVEASFKTGIISVDFDESKLGKDKIIDTVKSEGYSIK